MTVDDSPLAFLAVTGPTASGKTDLSLALAAHLDAITLLNAVRSAAWGNRAPDLGPHEGGRRQVTAALETLLGVAYGCKRMKGRHCGRLVLPQSGILVALVSGVAGGGEPSVSVWGGSG